MRKSLGWWLVLLVGSWPLGAQEEPAKETDTPPAEEKQEPEKWDVTAAHGEALREIDFEVDQGTWMSVDVSPDGTWLVFDLLGQIYRLDIEGGEAECLTQDSGVAINSLPVISPDGRQIAFISDRAGQDALWVMESNGSEPRALTSGKTTRAAEPTWHPSGDWIGFRHVSWRPGSWPKSDLRMAHVDGGKGIVLVSEGSGLTAPGFSKDGRYLYYQHTASRRQDLLGGGVQVRRLDLETGEEIDITAGTNASQDRGSSGSAVAPRISPDGQTLAFARRIPDGTIEYRGHLFGPRNALWLRDLASGTERLALDPIEIDISEGGKAQTDLPNYAWLPDGSGLVLSRNGKLVRLDLDSLEAHDIPFRAQVRRTLSEPAQPEVTIGDGPAAIRFARWQTRSPDGKRLAFEAAGRVWVARQGRKPQRITSDAPTTRGGGAFEATPSWSPDGRSLAYTRWGQPDEGHVWVWDVATKQHRQLTEEPGEYLHPTWRPDGSALAVVRGSGATFRGRGLTRNEWWDVGLLPPTGGTLRVLARTPAMQDTRIMPPRPSWGPHGRLYFNEIQEDVGVLVSVDLEGENRREHVRLQYAEELVISPDGGHVAAQSANEVYVAQLPLFRSRAEVLELELEGGPVPSRRVSTEGGFYPRFLDAETLEFGDGPLHVEVALQADDTEEATTEWPIGLSVPRLRPEGRLALTGARLVTLGPSGVIETGSIVIEDGRIACVGSCALDGDETVLEADGLTIVPGFVDLHAHHHRENVGVLRPRDPEQAIYLAYGVTTSFNPYSWAHGVFPTAEAVETGELIGPRMFSVGDPMEYGTGFRKQPIESLDEALRVARRNRDWGAIGLKDYVLPTRSQRQWVSEAGRQLGLLVTAEGSHLNGNLGMIMDGHTAWEHSISYVPLREDGARFLGEAGAVYSPTFVVGGPASWDEEYFYQRDDVWKDEKLRSWLPWRESMPHTRRRTLRPESDYAYPLVAEGLADIIKHGGFGVLGSHGQHHGIATHWEIWMAASALGPEGALEVASLHGAKYLGLEQEIGSLEVGKLADLLVLDANPLEDIENTKAIRWVVKDGIVRDGITLDEVWPQATPFGFRFWDQPGALIQDSVPIE